MTIVIIVIVLVVIAVVRVLIARQTSHRRQFGPEYDQLVKQVGPRQARSEFAKRQKRVAGLDLKELSPEQRAAYEARWEAAQEQFIDNPRQATQTAAGLVTAVAAESGYPVGQPGPAAGRTCRFTTVDYLDRVPGARSAPRTRRRTGRPRSSGRPCSTTGPCSTT